MRAPRFSLPDQDGQIHSLDDYKGRWLLVYFYPKDNTPGCTAQACALRDGRDELQDLGITVVGISKDTVASHKKFESGHKLNFTLLSDKELVAAKAFGSWRQKKFMGREYMGVCRDSYLIDPNGEIVRSYLNVNPLTHYRHIIEDFKTLTSH